MIKNDISFSISRQTQDTIAKSVRIETQSEWNEFLADAINTYIELGRLRQQGVEFHLVHEDRKALMTLKFPFEINSDTKDSD